MGEVGEVAGEKGEPRLSVVIPTYHRPDLLQRCLDGVLAQSMSPASFEVIVVDDGRGDDIAALVEEIARNARTTLRYVRPGGGRGPAVARNAGWRAARGGLIAFTDDDTIPETDWLARGEAAMRDHADWSACGGAVVVPLEGDCRARPTDHELMTMGLEKAEFVTANAFVRRSALLLVQGFDERFERAWCEDSDLQFRLTQEAGPVARIPDAVVLHPVRRERWGISLRQQKNAFFDALLYKKHPRLYRERLHASPPWDYYGIVGGAGSAIVAAALQRWWLAAALALVAAGLVARFAWRRLKRTSRAPGHVSEMIATSALIPFLSVYWRLRGALAFRVLFL